ncbi:receptor-like protein 9b [Magnolia sinica]|uniref:receptor-like protein 9b n=1 Tax=Magnolia sinica TaxID=86752 RepID=UPI002659C326|nr:receptor-like protein 9b [Magnolia sinica]
MPGSYAGLRVLPGIKRKSLATVDGNEALNSSNSMKSEHFSKCQRSRPIPIFDKQASQETNSSDDHVEVNKHSQLGRSNSLSTNMKDGDVAELPEDRKPPQDILKILSKLQLLGKEYSRADREFECYTTSLSQLSALEEKTNTISMDWALVMWLWALVFVQYCSHWCLGYLDKERTSLLEIKASINYPNGSYLPTWEDGTDCCRWERIKCNNATGRVTEISLDFTREDELGEWYLNADLLLSFGELRSLDLSGNYLAGWVDHEGFKRWSRLSKLEHLDLSYNPLTESILPYLGALLSLKSLSLRSSNFGLPDRGIEVEYSPPIILYTSFEMLSRLGNLEQLDLSQNQLNVCYVGPTLMF